MPLLKLDRDGTPVPLNHKSPDRRPTRSPRLSTYRWQLIRSRIIEAARRANADCMHCHGPEIRGHPRLGFTVEHIVPRSKGGTDEPENLGVAHRACNSAKGAR